MPIQFKHTVIAALTVVASVSFAQEQVQVIKIGHVAPMSGAQAHYGRDNENGARMAVEEMNAKKIKVGGKVTRFELVAEDDGADPKQGTAVAQKLCDAKVAGVIGHLNSGTTIPASKIYNNCGIPHITPAATNPALTRPGYKTTFRLLANDDALGARLAVYAAKTLKLKQVAVIDDRTAYGQGLADVFKKVAKEQGLTIVDEQYTTDKETNFTTILTSIKAKNPQAIFYGGMDPQGGPMLRQMEQLGLTQVKFFGGDGICTKELPKLAANAKTVANVVCAEGGASLDKMPGGLGWRERYEKKFPGQFQLYSPYVYDATNVLMSAIQRANSADPKVYLPFLVKTNSQGVTSRVQFDERGELKDAATTLYVFKDGQKTPLR